MNIQKIAYPLLGLTLAGAIAFAGTTPAVAAEAASSSHSQACQSEDLERYGVDTGLLCKIIEVGDSLEFGSDEKSLTTTLTDDQLKSEHGFTQQQVTDFRAILAGTYKPKPAEGVYADRSSRFYISNEALQSGTFAVLATAASAGPEALSAAFVTVSSLMTGGVGTIISGGVALLGTGFFVALAAKITGALAQGKGVAFYPKWDFPPLRVEIE